MTQLFKQKVRVYNQYVGVLGHDNKLFDRTCPNCQGWYCSAVTANCPTCGAVLTFLTSKGGKRMAVSEGTFYPILGNQQEKDKEQTLLRGGLLPTYRFKMFSFAGPDEALVPPAAHMHCTKRAVVKITIVNHQPIYKPFKGEDGDHVEILLPIYAGFGDKIEVIQDAKEIAAYEDSVPVDQTPTDQMDKARKILALQKQLNQLLYGGQNVPAAPEPEMPKPILTDRDISMAQPTELDESDPLFNEDDGQAAYQEQIKEVLGPEAVVTVTDAPFATE